MAKVQTSSLISSIRGSINKGDSHNGLTFEVWRTGINIVKAYKKPIDYYSDKQNAWRQNYRNVIAAWKGLSFDDKNSWVNAALLYPRRRLSGGTRDIAKTAKQPLTGFQYFLKINLFCLAAKLSIVLTPPDLSFSIPSPLLSNVDYSAYPNVIVNFTPSSADTTILWIYDPTNYFHKQIAGTSFGSFGQIVFAQLSTKIGTIEFITWPYTLFGQMYSVNSFGNVSAPSATFQMNLVIPP
jgi:hypothetical protein